MIRLLVFLSFYVSFLSAAPIKIGMELSYPPFEMICGNGSPCGISVDIASEFGKYVEQPIEIQHLPFVGLIPSLKNGSIDLVISSLSITKERKKAIDFSEPYLNIGLCLLLNIHSKVNTIQEANQRGKIIVVKSGTSGEVYAKKFLSEATVRILDKEAMCILEVIQSKADAFIYDQLSVYNNWKKNPTTTRANLQAFQKEQWAFGIKKDNTELLNKVNSFIKKFRAEGGIEQLIDQYLPGQKKAFEQMGVPFVF